MKKKFLFTVITLASTLPYISAHESGYANLSDIYKTSTKKYIASLHEEKTDYTNNDFGKNPDNMMSVKREAQEVKYKDITLTQAGTLASELGEEINKLDSLVVRGPVDAADIHTMWSGTFFGNLKALNLEYAQLPDNKLPAYAFFDASAQELKDGGIICIRLRRIILPEGLEEFGEGAFYKCSALQHANIPSTVRVFKDKCFYDCSDWEVNSLVIPEGVVEIGEEAFKYCRNIGKVVLPSTIKRINRGAFSECGLFECNFPEGLEEIGDKAFYYSYLREAILTNTCPSFTGDSQFMGSGIRKIILPEGMTAIPGSFVESCSHLVDFEMPNTIEVIGENAFKDCISLEELKLSTSLKSVDTGGFYNCQKLKTITFPAAFESLGENSCQEWESIQSIYCEATVPPVCIKEPVLGLTPFGGSGHHFEHKPPRDTPVIVPVGSVELYQNAWGWDYFSNIKDTNGGTGIQDTWADESLDKGEMYDLYGRKIATPLPNQIYIKNGKKLIAK